MTCKCGHDRDWHRHLVEPERLEGCHQYHIGDGDSCVCPSFIASD